MGPLKYCRKCKAEKEPGKRCKPCELKWRAENREKNREKLRAQAREWYANNREKVIAENADYAARKRAENPELVKLKNRVKAAKWRAANPDKAAAAWRRWSAENPDKKKAAYKKWLDSHREQERERGRKWRLANLDYLRDLFRAWRRANPHKDAERRHKRRSAKNQSPGHYTQADWRAIVAKQKGKCAICRKKKKLTVDHIIPLSKGGSNMAVNIQGLCYSCNSRKHANIPPDAQYSLFDKAA